MTPWSTIFCRPELDYYLSAKVRVSSCCDRPVNASAAYLFTTAERARDMRQSPVYVLNHSQHNFRQRTTQEDLDEIEDWTDRATRRMYEGAGLGPEDVDIFNPYDGYAPMAQFPYGHVHDSIEQLRGTAGARQVRVARRPRWRHSPRQAMAAGSCSANPRADGV
jgi:hypothetical protein